MKNAKNVTLKSKVVAFQKALDLQAQTIKSLLNQLILPSNSKSLTLLEKSNKSSKVSKAPKEVKEKKVTGTQVFLDALSKIGRPSTTSEIAIRMRKFNPTYSHLAKNKKQFMQLLYTNASQLSKDGLIVRTAISKRMYEYALKDWANKSEVKASLENKNPVNKKKLAGVKKQKQLSENTETNKESSTSE